MTTEVPLTQGLYAARATRTLDGGRSTIRLSTFLTGWPLTDHVNGDGLDNRRANLRPASGTQNRRNARRRADNSSGYRGVWRDRNRWTSKIRVDGTRLSLGSYATPEEAAKAYDAAAAIHHGEFARFNFPSA